MTFSSCDVTKENEVKELVQKVMDLYKRIDIWVNSAGILTRKNFEELTEGEWDDIMNTNLKGVFFGCKQAIPPMVKTGKGSVVNISSFLSLIGKSDTSLYTASKGGVTALSRSLALRYAKYNVRRQLCLPGLDRHGYEQGHDREGPGPGQKIERVGSDLSLGTTG